MKQVAAINWHMWCRVKVWVGRWCNTILFKSCQVFWQIIFVSKIQTASTYYNYILVNILPVTDHFLRALQNMKRTHDFLLPVVFHVTSQYSCCSEKFVTCSYGAISQSVHLMISFSCRVMYSVFVCVWASSKNMCSSLCLRLSVGKVVVFDYCGFSHLGVYP